MARLLLENGPGARGQGPGTLPLQEETDPQIEWGKGEEGKHQECPEGNETHLTVVSPERVEGGWGALWPRAAESLGEGSGSCPLQCSGLFASFNSKGERTLMALHDPALAAPSSGPPSSRHPPSLRSQSLQSHVRLVSMGVRFPGSCHIAVIMPAILRAGLALALGCSRCSTCL